MDADVDVALGVVVALELAVVGRRMREVVPQPDASNPLVPEKQPPSSCADSLSRVG